MKLGILKSYQQLRTHIIPEGGKNMAERLPPFLNSNTSTVMSSKILHRASCLHFLCVIFKRTVLMELGCGRTVQERQI